MSELPGAIKERDEALRQERDAAQAFARTQADLWRRLQESREWTQIQEIVKANRDKAEQCLLNMDYSVASYATLMAHWQGYVRALDWVLGLPQQAIDKSK